MKIDEAIEILKEMKEKCIDKGSTYYANDKRVKKAEAIETVLNELEDNKVDLTAVYLKGIYDEENKWRDKIKKLFEEMK